MALTALEPPCSCCPPLQPSEFHNHSEGCYTVRHTDIQCQDSFRRRTDYEPEIVGKMLAVRSNERFPRCNYEET